MRTVSPVRIEACCSIQGRNSSIRGTMTHVSTPQPAASTTQSKAATHNRPCVREIRR